VTCNGDSCVGALLYGSPFKDAHCATVIIVSVSPNCTDLDSCRLGHALFGRVVVDEISVANNQPESVRVITVTWRLLLLGAATTYWLSKLSENSR
jgi:hypothetical protein